MKLRDTFLGWALLALGGCGSSSKAAPAAAPGSAGDAGAPAAAEITPILALSPGEVGELVVNEGASSVRLTTASGDEKYAVIVGSTVFSNAQSSFDYTVTNDAADTWLGGRKVTACSMHGDKWQRAQVSPEAPPSAGAGPAVGSTRSLRVTAAGATETITVRAAAVGQKSIVWVDATPSHPATMDAAFIDPFLTDFENTILPRARSVFGVESDLDGDGRIGLVFTPLTKDVAVAFFTGCDLAATQGCPEGNRGEFLYLTPPANIDPPYNTPNAIKEILAHELGHLIHFNRKVLKNKLNSWPDGTYMIEGFGAFTQDAVGFQSGNLYVAMAGLDQIGTFSLADTLNDRARTDSVRDGALRGGSYWFVRYLYDRAGADVAKPDGTIEGRGGPAFLRDVLDGPKSVSASLAEATGTTLPDVALDFYTALFMSNGPDAGYAAPLLDCHAFLPTATDPVTQRQRGGNVRASFHGTKMKGPALSAAAGKLRSGGVVYVPLDGNGEAELPVQIAVDPRAEPRVRIARLR